MILLLFRPTDDPAPDLSAHFHAFAYLHSYFQELP